MATPGMLELGPISVVWDPRFRFPIGVHPEKVGWFITLCTVVYRYGKHTVAVPAEFEFDGASIPWFVNWIPGFHKNDWHLLAALPHDWICAHPDELPRPVGDGLFLSILVALADHRSTDDAQRRWRTLQAWAMGAAVRLYTIWAAVRGAPIQAARAPCTPADR